jgi:hypothetical protein
MNNSPVGRELADEDAALITELLRGVEGLVCAAWRKSYGRSGSLHFGALLPRNSVPEKAVHRSQGQWIISMWDCDRRVTVPHRGVVESVVNGDDALIEQLPSLEQKKLERIEFDAKSTSLVLTFEGGASLELQVDQQSDSQSEQWAVEIPDGRAIIMYGQRRWVLEPARPG